MRNAMEAKVGIRQEDGFIWMEFYLFKWSMNVLVHLDVLGLPCYPNISTDMYNAYCWTGFSDGQTAKPQLSTDIPGFWARRFGQPPGKPPEMGAFLRRF
jgi:hypothetical protein